MRKSKFKKLETCKVVTTKSLSNFALILEFSRETEPVETECVWRGRDGNRDRVIMRKWPIQSGSRTSPQIGSQQAENPKRWWYNSSMKAGKPETQEELMFEFKSKAGKQTNEQTRANLFLLKGTQSGNYFLTWEGSLFGSIQTFRWLDETHTQ